MAAQLQNHLGKIVVSNQFIAQLVGIAVNECYGVVGMASRNRADGLVSLLKIESLSKGIKVDVNEDTMSIDMHIILEYGVNIPVICQNLVQNVKYSVESSTGFKVDKVNVFVEGIRVDE